MNGVGAEILDELEWRGLIAACTDFEGLKSRLKSAPITLYCGFDPTADSLHVGNLVPLLTLRRFQIYGHRPIAVAGGATGAIGDPSGKSQERKLLSYEQIRYNIARVKQQLERLLDFSNGAFQAVLVDNAEWLGTLRLLDFLRDVGKHFSVNSMLAKESVRNRLEDREQGISYTEFSYMLLQAYDFYYLRQHFGCELQIGGSDQWGNITAGIDLVRKKLGVTVFGLTLPLITNADGTKFGKTEAGAVWLDKTKTSVYQFYQFWVRTDDRDVIRYLRYFTLLSKEQIDELAHAHQDRPEAREAHRALAFEVTRLVHGETEAQEAARASLVLFGGDIGGISEETFEQIIHEVPSAQIPADRWSAEGELLIDLLLISGLCASRSQAKKEIAAGGIYVNNRRVSDINYRIGEKDLLYGKYVLLRKGKKNYFLIRLHS